MLLVQLKNISFSISAREIISPIKLSWKINFSSWFLFFLSLFFVLNLKVYNVNFQYLVLTKSGEPCPASRRYWTRGVRSRVSSPNGKPGNRTVDAKYFTSKPPSIRCIDTYVDLRGGYENILFGERRRGKGVVPSSSLKVTCGKKKKRSRGGQRNKITTSMVVKVILTLQWSCK